VGIAEIQQTTPVIDILFQHSHIVFDEFVDSILVANRDPILLAKGDPLFNGPAGAKDAARECNHRLISYNILGNKFAVHIKQTTL